MTNTKLFKKLSFAAVSMAMVFAAIGFSSCKSSIEKMGQEVLNGTWVSEWGEYYTIDVENATFDAGSFSYAGDHMDVKFTDKELTEGYIYFIYTRSYEYSATEPEGEGWNHVDKSEWSDESWYRYSSTAPDCGKWYAVHFQNLTKESVELSGAYGAKSSETSLKAAEKGDKSSIIKVAQCFEDGIGVEQNYGVALEYYNKANKIRKLDSSMSDF